MGALLRKYGASATINFELFQVDGVDFEPAATFAAGDLKIMKDEGAEANTTNLPTDEGQGYSLVLTATEMQAARIVVYVVDQTATKVWLDRAIIIETYGNASAQHAFDLDTATQDVNTSTISASAITATAIASNAITSAKIATDAIGAAQIAANAIGSSELATDAIGSAQIAADAIGASEIANGAIDAATFAAGAIDATAIATGAIDADSLAADVQAKIIGAVTGTADAGSSSTTIVDAERTEATTDYWQHSVVVMTGGANVGQARRITAFNATTDTLTVAPAFKSAVGTGDTYTILATSLADGLRPTTEGNEALDVTATGAAGIDWGNVENPTTAVDLAGTDIQLCDTVTANTDMRGTDSAALASVCTEARLSELDAATGGKAANQIDLIKTDTAAILTDTGTTLDTKLNDIQGATFSSATDSLEAIRDRGDAAWTTGSGTGLSSLATGTAQAGAAGSITLAAGAGGATDLYKGARIATTGGTGVGQSRMITAFNDTTKVASVAPNWVTNPDATTTYEIQAADSSLGTIQNDPQSVTDLKDFSDAGYDPATNKVQGVVLVDTTTTNTDMVGTNSAALASVCTEARLSELDAATGGKAANQIDLIKTDTAAILTDTAEIGTAGAGLTDLGGMSTTMKGQVNTEVDSALDTAIPGTPTADSINERVKAIDDLTQAAGSGDLAAIKTKTDNQPEGIKKNAALSNFEFLMVDSTDHVTPKTGLTVTGQRSIDGGAFAAVGGSIAEVANGIYQFDALAADTNGDLITWRFSAAAADDVFFTFKASP